MKSREYLAKRLADYGINGAGCDPIPEQKEWAADNIEAAISLLIDEGWSDQDALDFGFMKITIQEMRARAETMRLDAVRLSTAEDAKFKKWIAIQESRNQ